MTREGIQAALDDMRRRIVQQFDPEKIILFGSFARGSEGNDIDLDFLIVIDFDGSLRDKANEIDMALADRTLPIDLVLVTPAQFNRQRNLPGTIVREAVREGKVIYDRAA